MNISYVILTNPCENFFDVFTPGVVLLIGCKHTYYIKYWWIVF